MSFNKGDSVKYVGSGRPSLLGLTGKVLQKSETRESWLVEFNYESGSPRREWIGPSGLKKTDSTLGEVIADLRDRIKDFDEKITTMNEELRKAEASRRDLFGAVNALEKL